MKIEIEIMEGQYKKVEIAARNLKMSPKKFIVRAIRKSTIANQEKKLKDSEITASLNAFFESHPNLTGGWWTDRSWDDCQSGGPLDIRKDRAATEELMVERS